MAGSPRKRAKRLGIDPLDEPGYGKSLAPVRPSLGLEPHTSSKLSTDNRERVIAALIDGYPKAAIARALGVSCKVFDRLIKEDRELEGGVEAQLSFEESELRDILMELARKGDAVAAIFLAKARHGWRDRDDLNTKAVPSGGGVVILPATVPLEEWSAAAALQQAKYREPLDKDAIDREFRRVAEAGKERMQQALPWCRPA